METRARRLPRRPPESGPLHAYRDPLFLLLILIFAAACLGLGSPGFIDFDSAQFALAVGQHDMEFHQPQPPGFITYVWLAQAANAVAGDPFLALRLVAIALLIAAAGFLYALARDAYDRTTARVAAGFFLASPVVVFHGLTTAIYPAEAFACAVMGWGCYRMQQGNRAMLLGLALVAGMIGGLRQTAMGFAAPLLLLAAIRGRFAPRDWILAILAGITGVLSWFLPQLQVAGGLHDYLEANETLQTYISSFSPFRAGAEEFLTQAHRGATVLILGFGAAKLLLLAVRAIRRRSGRGAAPDPAPAGTGIDPVFALTWVAPSLAFVFLYHFPKSGYALAHWPALCLGLAVLARRVSGPAPVRGLLGAALALDLAVFFFLPTMHIGCRVPWEIKESLAAARRSVPSTIAKKPWVPSFWYRPTEWDERTASDSSPYGPRYRLARALFGKADFLFDRTRDFYFVGEVPALRAQGLPREDTLILGRQLARVLCYEMPDQLLIHADPMRPLYPFLLYRDRKAHPVGPVFEVPPEVRWILLDGRPDEILLHLTPDGRPKMQGSPPPIGVRVQQIEIGDGAFDATYIAKTVPRLPDRTLRLVRGVRVHAAGALACHCQAGSVTRPVSARQLLASKAGEPSCFCGHCTLRGVACDCEGG